MRRNCTIKHVIEGRIDEEEDISSYWMTLRKGEESRN
jgi:hypothetical protein